MLLYTSFLDVKKREVEDKVWIIFSLIGIILNYSQYEIISYLFSLGITAAISFSLYFLGFYGGADAKALITLSFILPYYPANYSFHTIAPIITLTNGIFITLTLPLSFILINTLKIIRGEKIFEGFEEEGKLKKLIAIILGFRSKKVRKFMFPLEKEEEGKRRFDFKLLGWYNDYVQEEDKWVTPAIPLLVFISLGFLFMILFGDIISFLMYKLKSF
ncbi:hypothetical protein HRbin06_00977 [archaeon HR06]|nr:hypothetical protein HRbin06_00977 [archaeon HR06]